MEKNLESFEIKYRIPCEVEVLYEDSPYSIEVAIFEKERRASVYVSSNEFEKFIPDFILDFIASQITKYGFLHNPIECNSSGKWVIIRDEIF